MSESDVKLENLFAFAYSSTAHPNRTSVQQEHFFYCRLCLVQAARELSQARKQQAQIEHQLKLVAFHVDLDEIDRQGEIVQERSAERERKETRVNWLDEQLACLACQRAAETALLAIQRGLDTSAHYKAEIQRLQKELDELDRLERDELQGKRVELERLKALQSHLAEIQGLKDARGQANAEREQLESILSLAGRQKEPRRKLVTLPDEEKAARDIAENARQRLKATSGTQFEPICPQQPGPQDWGMTSVFPVGSRYGKRSPLTRAIAHGVVS